MSRLEDFAPLIQDVQARKIQVSRILVGDGKNRFIRKIPQCLSLAAARTAVTQQLNGCGQTVLNTRMALNEVAPVNLTQQFPTLEFP